MLSFFYFLLKKSSSVRLGSFSLLLNHNLHGVYFACTVKKAFFCSGSSIVMRLVGQQAGQPESQYAGQQAAGKSIDRQAG